MKPVWGEHPPAVSGASSADAGKRRRLQRDSAQPPQERATGADGDGGGAQHLLGSVLLPPMLPSHILTDQGMQSPAWGNWHHSVASVAPDAAQTLIPWH